MDNCRHTSRYQESRMRLTLLLLTTFPFASWAQGNVLKVNGMNFLYKIISDSIEITISAPTQGWVGVGFNSENNIVGSDLLLFHVIDGEAASMDMYVKGFGNPKLDRSLGGEDSIHILSSKETRKETTIVFRIAFRSGDPFDYTHELNEDFWLILAYSTHDEFDHHSRMRKHVKYRFK